jgi:hypothetical protein
MVAIADFHSWAEGQTEGEGGLPISPGPSGAMESLPRFIGHVASEILWTCASPSRHFCIVRFALR